MGEVLLKELVDRIERLLARAGERWLDPETGDEFIRAEWRPENADTEVVCFSRRDRDGSLIVLNPVDLPYCQISTTGTVQARPHDALEQIVTWLDELEASLEDQ